jgi:hypothetical protein
MPTFNQFTLSIAIVGGIIHIRNVVEYTRGRASLYGFYQAAFILPLVLIIIYHCLT